MAQTQATDFNFTEPAILCDSVEVQFSETEKKLWKIEILTDDLSTVGVQKAIALISVAGNNDSTTAHTGKLNIEDQSGNFVSRGKEFSLDLSIHANPRESTLRIQHLEDGQWKEYYNGSVSCSVLQYGSEGLHN